MFEKDPSKPIVWSRFARLTAVALALATTLLLAISAQAGAASSSGSNAEGPVLPVPAVPDPEGVPVPVPVVPAPPVVPEGGPEAAPAGSGTEGVPVPVPTGSGTEPSPEGAPVVPSGGAPELVTTSPPEVPDPVPPPEVPEPPPPPHETAPEKDPPQATEGVSLETVPAGKGKEDSQETVPPGPGREGTSENSSSSAGVGSSQDGGSSGHSGGEVLAPAPSLLAGPIAEASTVAGQRNGHPTTASGEAGAGATAGIALLQRPGDLTCELSALVGRMPSSCLGGPGGPQPLSASPMSLIASADSLASVDAVSPPDGGHGSSAVVRLPVSPAPGPAPSGVSGGAAAGTSGLALSGFLTLAGLLLMAAPRAMRRLRLSCQPWLTACFVLIPERPG